MAESDSKELSNLRVVDLRAELEKRGLDKTGVKANLIERLQKALIQEGKDPETYEFDLSDKKPSTKRSTTRPKESDSKEDQSANDSSVLMIETPSLDTGLDTSNEPVKEEKEEKSKDNVDKDENVNAESPLNLSIGEEEENLLNSGDEHEKPTEEKKIKCEDVKPAVSNVGSSSDNAKELDNSAKEHDEDDEDEGAEEETANREEVVAEDNLKHEDSASATNEVSSSTAASASTNTAPKSDKDSPKDKDKEKDKDKDKNTKSNPGRSLWVTNLLPSTRAQELKHLLSRYGKVIGAKVVQSSRYPRQRCYGYVTMETRAAADLCIKKLNNTELKGQIIRVAKVRPEHSLPLKSSQKQSESKDKEKEKDKDKDKKKKSTPEKNGKSKSPEKKKELDEKKKDDTAKKGSREPDRERHTSRTSDKKTRSVPKQAPPPRPDRKSDILTFDKIREERDRQRQRERERIKREEEKRRREIQRAREIEKRQREEALRLEREREKLRMERERLDRQRVEIMRLERERQRLEREKLEQEKQELRRQQLRLEEARRPVKRPASASSSAYRRGDSATYTDDRKRIATNRHYDETPPPPRFEVSSREPVPELSAKKELPKDYKSRLAYPKRSEEYPKRSGEFKRDYPPADRHPSHLVHSINSASSSSKYESSSYVNRERERDIREPGRREAIIPNVSPPRISKEARYGDRSGERSPVSYRPVRDERERRPVADHHTKADIRSSRDHRYTETAMKENLKTRRPTFDRPTGIFSGIMSTPPAPAAPSLSLNNFKKKGARYREGNSWHSGGASVVKPFSGISATVSSRESWSKSDNWRPMESGSNDRWANSSSRLLMSSSSNVPNAIYSGGNSTLPGIKPGLSCQLSPGNNSYSMDRKSHKPSILSSKFSNRRNFSFTSNFEA